METPFWFVFGRKATQAQRQVLAVFRHVGHAERYAESIRQDYEQTTIHLLAHPGMALLQELSREQSGANVDVPMIDDGGDW